MWSTMKFVLIAFRSLKISVFIAKIFSSPKRGTLLAGWMLFTLITSAFSLEANPDSLRNQNHEKRYGESHNSLHVLNRDLFLPENMPTSERLETINNVSSVQNYRTVEISRKTSNSDRLLGVGDNAVANPVGRYSEITSNQTDIASGHPNLRISSHKFDSEEVQHTVNAELKSTSSNNVVDYSKFFEEHNPSVGEHATPDDVDRVSEDWQLEREYLSHHIVERDLSDLDLLTAETGSGTEPTTEATQVTEESTPTEPTTEGTQVTEESTPTVTATPTTATVEPTSPPDLASECEDSSPEGGCRPELYERCVQDKHGVKRCECLAGYEKPPSGGDCTAVATEYGSLAIETEWNDAYLNEDSTEFKLLEADIVKLMETCLTSSLIELEYPDVVYMSSDVSYFSNVEPDGDMNNKILEENTTPHIRKRRQTGNDRFWSYVYVKFEQASYVDSGFNNTDLEYVLESELSKNETYASANTVLLTQPDQLSTIDAYETDPCQEGVSYCSANAYCVADNSWFSCNCTVGYEDTGSYSDLNPGEVCTEIAPTCPINYCLNQGRCVDNGGSPTCDCSTWFSGERCQNDLRVLVAVIGGAVLLYLITILIIAVVYNLRSDKGSRESSISDSWDLGRTGSYASHSDSEHFVPPRRQSSISVFDRERWLQIAGIEPPDETETDQSITGEPHQPLPLDAGHYIPEYPHQQSSTGTDHSVPEYQHPQSSTGTDHSVPEYQHQQSSTDTGHSSSDYPHQRPLIGHSTLEGQPSEPPPDIRDFAYF